MEKTNLLAIAKPYGVKFINFGGCVDAQAKGWKGRKAHAHCRKGDPWLGWICFFSHIPERCAIQKNGQPTQLFWHEVGHIYRPSWTQKQCDKFGWQQARTQKR